MKSEELETLSKQAEAALRKSEERFRLVVAASELKRESLIPQAEIKTTSSGSQRAGG